MTAGEYSAEGKPRGLRAYSCFWSV